MTITLKPIEQQVIVITGASSGIGLATARAASERGARVVIASRNGSALQEIERELNAKRGNVQHVVADVGRREDVEKVSALAVERFGGYDTWVNNAGLSIWGRLEEVPEEDHRRLFETNFWGLVYGSLVAAAQLKIRGGGAIVNLGSVASDIAFPLQGMYCASKHAVKGFTDAFRIELEEQECPISVTLIKPAAINTPFPQHARNYTNKEPKLPDPVYPPEEVSGAILYAAAQPIRDIYIGGGGVIMSTLNKHLPKAMDWLNENVMSKQQLRDESPRDAVGALHHPGKDGKVHGDHPGYVNRMSFFTQATTHPLLAGAVLGAAGFAVAMLAGGEKRR